MGNGIIEFIPRRMRSAEVMINTVADPGRTHLHRAEQRTMLPLLPTTKFVALLRCGHRARSLICSFYVSITAIVTIIPQRMEKAVKSSSLHSINLGEVSFVEGLCISHQPFLQDTDSHL